MESEVRSEAAPINNPTSKTFYFSFTGNGATLFGIQIINLLFIIITLGIYYFWAKVRVRNYIWSQIDVHGDRLAYHGTGKEAILGWLKAMLIFGIPFYILQNIPQLFGAPLLVTGICAILATLLIFIFIPIATIGMRRYRFSRTSLRGIRFSFRGRWTEFARIFYAGLGLMFITFGFYKPYFDMRVNTYIMQKTFFGSKGFGFDGKGSDLFKYYLYSMIPVFGAAVLICLIVINCISGPVQLTTIQTVVIYILSYLLFLLSLIISLFIYGYFSKKYTWNHMTFDNARFQSTITFGGYFWLYFTNLLLLMVTLGFALPWVKVRTLDYILENLTLTGDLNIAAIVQEAQASTATGEEIGDFLELDLDLA